MNCQGQVIIVTGGASGLGRACAEALLAKQAKVVIWDKQNLSDFVSDFNVCQCDVTSEASVEAALQQTIK